MKKKSSRKYSTQIACLAGLALHALPSLADETPVPTAEVSPETTKKFFDQGWEKGMRHQYYYTAQGSHLMPYDWFLAIEQSNSEDLFSAPESLKQFGWSWPFEDSSEVNPDNLPIGFTKSLEKVRGTGKWLGWTCAACHTGELTVKGNHYRLDGGPSQVDIGRFLTAFDGTVRANIVDPEKFKRFAARVLGEEITPQKVNTLKQQYLNYTSSVSGRIAMRTPTHPAGPGRVDALNQIINAMSVTQLGEPDNFQSPDAPVSFPFLWYTPRLSWVQWSPISSNPIGRNAGQVLGVFGHADFIRKTDPDPEFESVFGAPDPKIEGQEYYEFLAKNSVPESIFRTESAEADIKIPVESKAQSGFLSSTANYQNLYQLEKWLEELSEPIWNEEDFGPIDRSRGETGAALFKKDCRSCHNMPPFDMTEKEQNIIGKQFIKIGRIPYKVVGTDSTYNETLIGRLSKTGDLGPVIFEDEEVVPSAQFFLGGVAAVVEKGLGDLGLTQQQKLLYSDFRYYPAENLGEKPKPYRPTSVTDLKAGPLLGIWATGPFLHNGSVPNLYELLSPPEQRSKGFWTGSHELDTEKLGYLSTEQDGLFYYDTTVKGNGNGGHVYPSKPYTEEEKKALLEFLKNPTLYSTN